MPRFEPIDHRCPDCGMPCCCSEGGYDCHRCVHPCNEPNGQDVISDVTPELRDRIMRDLGYDDDLRPSIEVP